MTPSFSEGDLLLVRRRVNDAARLVRGEVVITADPRSPLERYLKRIVGLPTEEVRLAGGVLYIDGKRLDEPYLGGLPAYLGLEESDWTLGDGDYFVMGDNRAHSTDSRDFGPLSDGLICGRAWLRLWPPSRWGRVRAG